MQTVPQTRVSNSLSATLPFTTHLLVSPSFISNKERDLGKDGGVKTKHTPHELLEMQTDGAYRGQTQLSVFRPDKMPPEMNAVGPTLRNRELIDPSHHTLSNVTQLKKKSCAERI